MTGDATARATTLLVNTHSRRGRGLLGTCVRALEARGLRVRVAAASCHEEAAAVLRSEVAARAPLVIVGGGDGTLSHAAGVLAGTGTALGVLPLGSGNTFARSVGVPRSVGGAARVIAGGRVQRVDVGRVNGSAFLNSVALGFSAEIARTLNSRVKRRLGLLAWPYVGLRVLRTHQPIDVRVTLDTDVFDVHTHQLLVANGRYVAGPLKVTRDASVVDDRLDVLALGDGRLWSLARVGFGWAAGARAWHASTSSVLIESHRGDTWISVDGEVSRASRLLISVDANALAVLVPAGFNGGRV